MSSRADEAEDARPVTVAELLARNGTQPGSRAHRRRTRKGGITVAELTGEIPVIRDVPDAIGPGDDISVEAHAEQVVPEFTEPEATEPEATEPEATEPEPVGSQPEAETGSAETQPAEQATKTFTSSWVSRGEAETTVGLLTSDSAAAELMRARYEDVEYGAAERGAPDLGQGADDQAGPAAEVAAGEDGTDGGRNLDNDEDEDGQESAASRGALKQWAVIAVQCVVAIVAGALLFKGFEKLWDVLPWVALVLAVLVVLGLVALVRILRKTDDIMSILIAVIAGLIVTLGPLAFLLSTR